MKQKIKPTDYWHFKKLEDIQASTNWIVWVEKQAEEEENGYASKLVAYNTKKNVVKQLSSGQKKDYHPRFSPDESKLAFISTRTDIPQLYVMDIAGGEAIAVSKKEHKIQKFWWSPAGDKIIYMTKIPRNVDSNEDFSDPRVISELIYRTGTEYIVEQYAQQLYVLDLQYMTERRITDLAYDYFEVAWLDSETVLALTILDKPVADYKVLVKLNINETSRGETFIQLFNPYYFINPVIRGNPYDPSKLLIRVFEEKYEVAQRAQIIKWGLFINGKLQEIINLQLDRSIVDVQWKSADQLIATINDSGYVDIREYNFATKQFTRNYEPFNSVESFASSDTDVYFIATEPQHPYAVWKLDTTGNIALIYEPNAEFLSDRFITNPETIWFKNYEGMMYQGWFFNAGEHAPTILSIHGGPHVMWNNAGTMWFEWQSQVSAGYSVFAMNPVGSDGYGEEFLRVICGNWGNKDARDLLNALDELVKRNKIDENKLYITGGSYAGFQTANIITFDHRFKAACAQRGVYNLLTLDAGGDIARFDELEYIGKREDKNYEKLWKDSPVSRVREISTPLLLIHSEQDYRVPISQAEHMFTEIRRTGKEVVLVRYPREGHELSRSGEPLHIIDRLQRIIWWFNQH